MSELKIPLFIDKSQNMPLTGTEPAKLSSYLVRNKDYEPKIKICCRYTKYYIPNRTAFGLKTDPALSNPLYRSWLSGVLVLVPGWVLVTPGCKHLVSP